jgi:thiamine biosynthesis protein ThiS
MIKVNGERSEWYPGKTVRDVIREKNYLFPLLIVRISGKLIPRNNYDSTEIPDEATVDIIHLMSGG